MSTVRKLLKAKGDSTTYAVESTDTVLHALKVMADANISAVMVKEGDQFVGILTERDYSRKVELAGLAAKDTPVRDIMTERMVTVKPETSVDECMGLMMKFRVRHLPVVENDKIVGVLSMRDIIEEVLENKQSVIAQLENYIMGSSFAT